VAGTGKTLLPVRGVADVETHGKLDVIVVWHGVVVVFDKRLAVDIFARGVFVDGLTVVIVLGIVIVDTAVVVGVVTGVFCMADITVVVEGFCITDIVVVIGPTIEGFCIANIVVVVGPTMEEFCVAGTAVVDSVSERIFIADNAVETKESIDVAIPAVVIDEVFVVAIGVTNTALLAGDPTLSEDEAMAEEVCILGDWLCVV
jgi:hypothetical protein